MAQPAAPTEQKPAAAEPKDGAPAELFAAALQAYEAGDLDAARKGFEKTLEKSPQSLNAQFNLGVIAERQGRPLLFQRAAVRIQRAADAHSRVTSSGDSTSGPSVCSGFLVCPTLRAAIRGGRNTSRRSKGDCQGGRAFGVAELRPRIHHEEFDQCVRPAQ